MLTAEGGRGDDGEGVRRTRKIRKEQEEENTRLRPIRTRTRKKEEEEEGVFSVEVCGVSDHECVT